jgi:hypothetical protein
LWAAKREAENEKDLSVDAAEFLLLAKAGFLLFGGS